MKGDSDVCPAVEDLSERQIGHIAPVLEGGADGLGDVPLPHVRGVVVNAVSQTSFLPQAFKRRIASDNVSLADGKGFTKMTDETTFYEKSIESV